MTDPFAPMSQALSEDELGELEHSLLNLDTEDGMLLESLDGYLHAIAMGPELVMPSRWLPQVWGQECSDAMPPVDDLGAAERLLGLITRHYNSILQGMARTAIRWRWTPPPHSDKRRHRKQGSARLHVRRAPQKQENHHG